MDICSGCRRAGGIFDAVLSGQWYLAPRLREWLDGLGHDWWRAYIRASRRVVGTESHRRGRPRLRTTFSGARYDGSPWSEWASSVVGTINSCVQSSEWAVCSWASAGRQAPIIASLRQDNGYLLATAPIAEWGQRGAVVEQSARADIRPGGFSGGRTYQHVFARGRIVTGRPPAIVNDMILCVSGRMGLAGRLQADGTISTSLRPAGYLLALDAYRRWGRRGTYLQRPTAASPGLLQRRGTCHRVFRQSRFVCSLNTSVGAWWA